MKILALDVATKTGWATDNAYGLWDFSLKRDESSGMRLIRFKSKLKEICALEEITMVVFEQVAGFHKGAIIVAAELIGVLKSFCEESQIEYRSFAATAIKKWACGKGNAGKPLMIKAAQEKLGYPGDNDNVSDALWLFNLAKKEFEWA